MHNRIRALGFDFTPRQIAGTTALFAPLVPPVDETKVRRDVSYGPDMRHRLDVFGVDQSGAPRPVVVFIHGGGFVRGDKGNAGDPFYNNIGDWALRQGWLGVTATYRLAPDNPWPAGAEDMSRLIDWLGKNAASLGGNPKKIVLMGQSAGAAHVASYIGCAPYSARAASTLAGAVMMSGIYDLVRLRHGEFEAAYYGSDSALFAERSGLSGIARTSVPCLFTVAEHDPENFQRQAAFAVAAWIAEKGSWPAFHWLEGQNHLSPAQQIGTSADEVGPCLGRFIKGLAQSA